MYMLSRKTENRIGKFFLSGSIVLATITILIPLFKPEWQQDLFHISMLIAVTGVFFLSPKR